MSFFAQLGPDPYSQQAGQLGQALAQGIGVHFQRGQMQNQQGQLANALFGNNASQFASLPVEQQLKAAEFLQAQQKLQAQAQTNQQIISDLEQRRNLAPGSLKAYVQDPKLAEQITRPPKEPKKTQASQPIDQEQLEIIKKVRAQPGFADLDELSQYQELTAAGVSKENAEVESKLRGAQLTRNQQAFDSAYKAQEPFINETTDKYRAFETEMKPRLMQMQNIPDEDLVSPTAAAFLEQLNIPLGALEDPSSELYQKLSQDLLKGLPETYGNRILKVEVDNFLKTIPTLLNSPEGRRMIASNMLKLGELKEVYYNEMRKQQQAALEQQIIPKDFQQRVFDQVKPQIDRINNEFVKLSEIKAVPKGTIPFFNPNGDVEFVPKEDAQWAMENGGRRIW
jgi:hypothetical protein